MATLGTGWVKDPHISDEAYHVAQLMKLPPSANNSRLLPLTGNQNGMNGCVGWGIGELCHTEGVKDGLILPKSPLAFSPWWLWNGARFIEGTLANNNGCCPSNAFRWLEEQGFLAWDIWPFLYNKFGEVTLDVTDPNSKASQAVFYPKFKKFRIDNGNTGIMDALASGFCVAIGAPWPSDWSAGDKAVQPKVTASSKVDSGHEYLIHSYTDNSLYNAMNSWGNWGQIVPFLETRGGFSFQMEDIDAFKQYFYGYDAYRIDVEMTPLVPPIPPVPPEPPSPKHCSCSQILTDILNAKAFNEWRHGKFYYR